MVRRGCSPWLAAPAADDDEIDVVDKAREGRKQSPKMKGNTALSSGLTIAALSFETRPRRIMSRVRRGLFEARNPPGIAPGMSKSVPRRPFFDLPAESRQSLLQGRLPRTPLRWDAQIRSCPDWLGSGQKSKKKLGLSSQAMALRDRKLMSLRSFGCPNASLEGRFIGDRKVVSSGSLGQDPPAQHRDSEILGSMTCQGSKNIKSLPLRSGRLAQETRGSERSTTCATRGSATLSGGK